MCHRAGTLVLFSACLLPRRPGCGGTAFAHLRSNDDHTKAQDQATQFGWWSAAVVWGLSQAAGAADHPRHRTCREALDSSYTADPTL
jgi:hypothetical protein